MQITVGNLIKNKRKEQDLTLQDVASRTGLSTAYLSLLERGKNSPTISNLHKICTAINTTMIELLSEIENQKELVKRDDRKVYYAEPGKLLYENMVDGDRSLHCTCLTIFDNDEHDAGTHITDELGIISSGTIIFTLEGNSFEMSSGDSVYVPAGSRHTFRRVGNEECVSYWVTLSHDS